MNIESFLGMDSYLCEDSEELCWKYDIIGPENTNGALSLVGIVGTSTLAKAGRTEDVLGSIRNYRDLGEGLEGACAGNHKELAELMIEKGAVQFHWGMIAACRNGHKEMALLMIREMEYNNVEGYWDYGLEKACCGGHKELAQLMAQKGAKICWNCLKHPNKH
jgi:hypothetical protein